MTAAVRSWLKPAPGDLPPVTAVVSSIALGLCIFGICFTFALVTTTPVVLGTIYALPLLALAAGLSGIFLGSTRALSFTRSTTGLLLAVLLVPLGISVIFSNQTLEKMGAASLYLYLLSLHLGLKGEARAILGPEVANEHLPRRIIAVAIIAVAFSTASWVWAARNGIQMF